jgi:CDP-glucose 4,6-dehydratase
MQHCVGDVRDSARVASLIRVGNFDVVLHLAAQSLVRLSYAEPLETYSTNIMGTVHLLEAVRLAGRPCVVVVVTTDKCYECRESPLAYREEDRLGGHDPYSSSKAAAELLVSAYRRSFFASGLPIAVASARAGNVVGGGDWARDRILPDSIRALQRGEPIAVRHPRATRPWQHVLEPLGGYLALAFELLRAQSAGDAGRLGALASPFNFGPPSERNESVATVVDHVLRHWPGRWVDRSEPGAPHEAAILNLSIEKAFHLLGWRPRWELPETLRRTVTEYRVLQGAGPEETSRVLRGEIAAYVAAPPLPKPPRLQSELHVAGLQRWSEDRSDEGVDWENHFGLRN